MLGVGIGASSMTENAVWEASSSPTTPNVSPRKPRCRQAAPIEVRSSHTNRPRRSKATAVTITSHRKALSCRWAEYGLRPALRIEQERRDIYNDRAGKPDQEPAGGLGPFSRSGTAQYQQ